MSFKKRNTYLYNIFSNGSYLFTSLFPLTDELIQILNEVEAIYRNKTIILYIRKD